VSGKSSHFYTGVSLEKPVVEYLDDLSQRMGMSRSWVLNTIVYEYAKLIENKKLMPQRSIEAVVRK
jgi:metal-responsive CopG/Arc/MetJ family transcriptional regulator